MTVLVIGGAGYIGAHVVRLLQQRGDGVLVVDDLSTGDATRIDEAEFVQLDISREAAADALEVLMRDHDVDAVIHFAAKKRVGESVERPAWYASQNIGGMVNVLAAMERSGVRRLVFSSSAAVYGMPEVAAVTEATEPRPINPYGRSKLVGEWLVDDSARAWGLQGANLRYFNVAGAGWSDLGDPAALNLVTMVFERMDLGERPLIFGADYPTPDGTCIRDYVHVLDLAEAHIAALSYVGRGDRPFSTFNVGTGIGISVREVIDRIGTVSGQTLEPMIVDRRAGDPPKLIADATRITEVLGWRAQRAFPEIIESAWRAHHHVDAPGAG